MLLDMWRGGRFPSRTMYKKAGAHPPETTPAAHANEWGSICCVLQPLPPPPTTPMLVDGNGDGSSDGGRGGGSRALEADAAAAADQAQLMMVDSLQHAVQVVIAVVGIVVVFPWLFPL